MHVQHVHVYPSTGIKKKLSEAARVSSLRKLNGWVKPTVNHFYKVCEVTEINSVVRREMWLSLVNHCSNIHDHPENTAFKKCIHDDILPKVIADKRYVVDWCLPGKKLLFR
jgi:hypothetical protein